MGPGETGLKELSMVDNSRVGDPEQKTKKSLIPAAFFLGGILYGRYFNISIIIWVRIQKNFQSGLVFIEKGMLK